MGYARESNRKGVRLPNSYYMLAFTVPSEKVMWADVTFMNEDLRGTNLNDQNLTGTEFIDCNLEGVSFARSDLAKADFIRCNLRVADFHRADLLGTRILNSNCTSSYFHRAYLHGTECVNSNFSNTVFDNAIIYGVDFSGSILDNSSMIDTLLTTAEFTNCSMENVLWKNGAYLTECPVTIHGLAYPITIYNGHMDIGCQSNKIEWYSDVADREVAAMEGTKSARFWRYNKEWIFKLLGVINATRN